jgi:hypothetical protein
LAKGESGLVSDRGLLLGSEFLDGGTVFAQIDLGSDQDEGNVGAVVRDLWVPLGPQVFERGRVDDGIGQQKDVRLRIRKGSQTIVIFLSSGIPETQINGLAIDNNIGRVTKNRESRERSVHLLVEYSGNVFPREGISGVGNQQAGLTDRSVSNDYALYGLHVLRCFGFFVTSAVVQSYKKQLT